MQTDYLEEIIVKLDKKIGIEESKNIIEHILGFKLLDVEQYVLTVNKLLTILVTEVLLWAINKTLLRAIENSRQNLLVENINELPRRKWMRYQRRNCFQFHLKRRGIEPKIPRLRSGSIRLYNFSSLSFIKLQSHLFNRLYFSLTANTLE